MSKQTIVFNDAYTKEERFGLILQTFGDTIVIRIISKEEAESNPIRILAKKLY